MPNKLKYLARNSQSTKEGAPPDDSLRQGGCKPRWQDYLTRAVSWCIWGYLAAVATVWLLLFLGGDRWWFSTLILFGPRWLCAVPLAVLGPLAALGAWAGLMRRWMLIPLAAAALVVVGPVMGFCLPWARLAASGRPTIRVLTCNVKGHCKENPALEELIRSLAPDMVALQGCWHQARLKWPEGWHVQQRGEMLVASRYEFRELALHDASAEFRVNLLLLCVATPAGDICFSTMHPQSPHQSINGVLDHKTILRPGGIYPMADEIEKRWRDAEATQEWLAANSQPAMVVGDLNLPPESAIYRHYWADYRDAFSQAGFGFGYTELPRMRKLRFGIRIDHILSSRDWRPQRCWVGPDIGSDHLPLIADLYRAE